MPRIVRFEATPNPNALKCYLDPPLPEQPPKSRSFRSAEGAADHALARALFAVDGVVGLLLMGDWLTINKAPGAAWPRIKREVRLILAAAG